VEQAVIHYGPGEDLEEDRRRLEQRVTAPDRLVSVDITLTPNGEFASIVYRAANGAAYDRGKGTNSQDRPSAPPAPSAGESSRRSWFGWRKMG
jgi:hypothetical protein